MLDAGRPGWQRALEIALAFALLSPGQRCDHDEDSDHGSERLIGRRAVPPIEPVRGAVSRGWAPMPGSPDAFVSSVSCASAAQDLRQQTHELTHLLDLYVLRDEFERRRVDLMRCASYRRAQRPVHRRQLIDQREQ